ncbi:STAS domain-containing protein [Streptomyces sp. NPDC089919]|uniref:STAS domain-containing protein n=1 Tax=Streptomyces sp. NPDC089919 TaxID=3155188 RepID=UPI00341AB834
MTNLPPAPFTCTARRTAATLTVRIAGELDHDTCDQLVETVVDQLSRPPAPRAVRLDFRHLTWIDSSGLSALLMVHRRTSALGAVLHLDDRPPVLERMLHLTNVLEYLTALAPESGETGPDDDLAGADA